MRAQSMKGTGARAACRSFARVTKNKGEKAPGRHLLPVTAQRASTPVARSQSWLLSATSRRMEVTRRVRVRRPDGARRCW
jgi:hypothetical protein